MEERAPPKKRKRKLVGGPKTSTEAEMPNTSSPPPLPPSPKKKGINKHSAKQANLVACNATAKSLFAQSDKVKSLEEEVARLREQV